MGKIKVKADTIKKYAVLVSGTGTNLQRLIDLTAQGKLNGKIAVVISDRREAHALQRAKAAGIDSLYIGKGSHKTPETREEALLKALEAYEVDFIVLAGYLSMMGQRIVKRYPNKIINIHPSLIPAFCGMGFYGAKVHEAVIARGVKYSGVTVHFVNEEADAGPIITQQVVEVLPTDTPETLARRIHQVEYDLLPKAVGWMINNQIEVCGYRVMINEEKGS